MDLQKKDRRFSLFNNYFAFTLRRGLSDRLLFNTALLAVCASIFFAVVTLNTRYTETIPTVGGTIVEGIVGTPRFVNPVLAINRADHDMVALIYSGLLKLNEQGELVNDIAEELTVSEDGRTYNVQIRHGVRFHNGQELQARDVAYTIALIQDPELKSPLRGNWDGVLVEELGDFELNIVLEEAYTPFKENFTVGILPRELWDELPIEQVPFSQNNTQPVGTGPYMVTDVLRNKSGLINAYKLSAFEASNQNPNISTLVFNFYQNEEELLQALERNEIASTPSLSPESFERIDTDTYQIIESPLPRTFALYINQNKSPALRDESVRKALDAVIDKQALVDQVLHGYGLSTNSPVPSGFGTVESEDSTDEQSEQTPQDLVPVAQSILQQGGWKKTDAGTWEKVIDKETITLSFTITTANTPLFEETATYIAEVCKSLGIAVTITQFEQNDLVQAIIRPRDFEVLLYGVDIGRQTDLYPFWHSSQKNDPGLNIAQYTNIDVDALLEKARTESDQTVRDTAIAQATAIIADEKPAIFLFVPTFGYVLDKAVTATPLTKLSTQSERFANVAQWHIKSNNIWPIFSHTN